MAARTPDQMTKPSKEHKCCKKKPSSSRVALKLMILTVNHNLKTPLGSGILGCLGLLMKVPSK